MLLHLLTRLWGHDDLVCIISEHNFREADKNSTDDECKHAVNLLVIEGGLVDHALKD